jgi:Domain of Unknown Function (DUF1080)
MKKLSTQIKVRSIVRSLVAITVALLTQVSLAKEVDERDISRFIPVGDANWVTENGVASANKGNGFLVSKPDFENFSLKVDFFAAPGTNSGVFLRCQDINSISDKTCYEVNIFDTRPDQTYRTGAITNYVEPDVVLNTEDNNWHKLEVYVYGRMIRVMIDGQETAYLQDPTHESGRIALQYAKGEIKFRNLQIELIKRHEYPKAPLIEGVWLLESFNTVDRQGNVTPWCEGAHGVIIYTEGYMSTAVNCTSDPNKVVLYSGPYRIEGQTVFHDAQNYSHVNLNKTFSRSFHLKDYNHLELKGNLGDSTVIVNWRRR